MGRIGIGRLLPESGSGQTIDSRMEPNLQRWYARHSIGSGSRFVKMVLVGLLGFPF